MPLGKKGKTGKVDGGEGRGVRLGGSDVGRRPTGYQNGEAFDDDEVLINDEATLEDFEAVADEDAGAPDRRRDPLRTKR